MWQVWWRSSYYFLYFFAINSSPLSGSWGNKAPETPLIVVPLLLKTGFSLVVCIHILIRLVVGFGLFNTFGETWVYYHLVGVLTIFVLGSSMMLPTVGEVCPLNVELFGDELSRHPDSRKALNLVAINQWLLRTNVAKDWAKLEVVKQNLPSYFVCS